MSKVKMCLSSYKHHAIKDNLDQVARLLTKLREMSILNPGPDTDYSETGFGCFTQSLLVNSSTAPLHRPSISSLSLQIHDS